MQFRTTIQQSGKTATGIQVPAEVIDALGAGSARRSRSRSTVEVDVDLDTAPREVDVPADFAAALAAEPEARRTFDGLSHSNQSWHVLQVEGAKTEETRQRRIAKSVDILKRGRAR